MKDPWNASLDEIRDWARSGDGWPDQDWDIAIAHTLDPSGFAQLIHGPAIDAQTRLFLIRCLYIHTGDAVRVGNQASIAAITDFIETSPLTKMLLARWADAARHLIAHPETYRHDF